MFFRSSAQSARTSEGFAAAVGGHGSSEAMAASVGPMLALMYRASWFSSLLLAGGLYALAHTGSAVAGSTRIEHGQHAGCQERAGAEPERVDDQSMAPDAQALGLTNKLELAPPQRRPPAACDCEAAG